jgi:hypothetical protein
MFRDCLIPDQTYLFNARIDCEAVRLELGLQLRALSTGLVVLCSVDYSRKVDRWEVVEFEKEE